MVITPVSTTLPRNPGSSYCHSAAPDLGSSIAPAATECRTELAILMCEIQNRLWQVGSLDDAPHLDSTLILDQLAYQVQELGRELSR